MASSSSDSAAPILSVMTYNIRMDTWKDGPNQWHHRRHRVTQLIENYSPDLLGVQEPVPQQMQDLRHDLKSYYSYGVGRDDGKDRGEYSAIFFRRDRFDLIDQGTFWLSEEPENPGTRGWDAYCPRICSWVQLNDRCSNKRIFYFNIHLDHEGLIARREGARLILSRIDQIAGRSATVLLTGDFNSTPDSDPYRMIVSNSFLQDAKQLSETKHSGPEGTWSTFNVKQGVDRRIDYIFITPKHFRVLKHSHLTDSENETYPSDHLPVLAVFQYK